MHKFLEIARGKEVTHKHQMEQLQHELQQAQTEIQQHKLHILELEELLGNKTILCIECKQRQRDCVILPCTHFLYCTECISKTKDF